jgi:hypothetical protein
MARKPRQTELSTGIALGERLATLEAGFQRLELFVQTRVRWVIMIAASVLLQTSGVPALEKFGVSLAWLGSLARHAIGF